MCNIASCRGTSKKKIHKQQETREKHTLRFLSWQRWHFKGITTYEKWMRGCKEAAIPHASGVPAVSEPLTAFQRSTTRPQQALGLCASTLAWGSPAERSCLPAGVAPCRQCPASPQEAEPLHCTAVPTGQQAWPELADSTLHSWT